MKNKCMTYLLCLMALLPATNGLVATKTGTTSVGTVQTITFDNPISAPDTTCSSLLSFTAGDLGTSPVCSISGSDLIIQLGDSMTSGTPTITLIPGGFPDGLTGDLTFTRISETIFIFSTGAAGSHYQDYVNKWTVVPVNTNGGTFTFVWTYASGTGGPSLPASGTTLVFDLNYWQATIGQGYSIAVNMTDDNNAQFYYASTGGVFTVLDSCTSSCDTVTWTMTNDPGTVSPNCTSGQGGDTVSCTKGAGGGPYQILATYNPTSLGEHADGLTLLEAGFVAAPTGFLLPATCGSTLSFPSVAVNTDALAIQSSGSQFAFEAAITNRGLTVTTDYTITWTATNSGGIGYCGTTTDSPTCTIPADGTLAAGTAYVYTVVLKLTCKSSIVWQDVTFTTFTYTAISTTTSTVGSVQTLTFTEPMSQSIAPSDPGSNSCGNVLVSAKVADVGIGARCTMPTSSTLQIEYGNGYTKGGNLELKIGGMDKWITHTFAKSWLPRVTYTAPMEGTTINQDSGNIFMIFNTITYSGSPTWLFTWECTAGPECPTIALASQTAKYLDLATSNLKKGGSYTFKGTVRQSGVTNYVMTESITVTFLILLKSQTQIGNTIVLQSAGHLFNLTYMDCSTIFDTPDQAKLGTGAICIHVVNSDKITIVLGDDTILRSTTPLTLKKDQYFEDYSITIFQSGSFSSGATTMKGSLWYIPLTEVVTLKGGVVSTNCADYFVATPGMIETTCHLESGGAEIVVRFASSDGITGKNTYTIGDSKFSKNIYGKHTNEMPDFLPTMINTSTPADGATDTQDVGTIVMTFPITAASTKAAPGWTYSWTCAPLANCPDMTSYTTHPLNLPAANIRYGGTYTITGLVKQDDTTIYNMTQSFTFLFLIRMKTDTQIGNTIVLQSAGHLFNLTGTDCTVIFDVTDQGLLGTGSTCTHVVNSDTITIVLGNDTSLRSTTPLTLTKNQYFEDYSITIFHSGSFSSGVTTMKGSLWYIPLTEVVTLIGGVVSTNCADYFVATPGMTDTTCHLESGGAEIVVRFASSDGITEKNTYTIDDSKFSKNIYGKHTNEMPDVVPTKEQKDCPALCGQCDSEGICQSCNSSKSHIKQINQGAECRCEDNYYYSSSAQNCQVFDKGASFDLGQSTQMITPDILRARYNYCSSLSPINQHYDEMINGIDILVITTTYSNLPTGIFNLLFTCRLKDLTSTSPLDFLEYDNCKLNETENGDYIVTFKISLDDIVNNDLCSFAQSTTGEKTIYLYTCQIAQWFMATETVPSANAAILKFNTRLKVSVDSKTMNKLYFSSNQIINIDGPDIIFNRDVNTTSVLCDGTCDGTNSGKSVILAGENITAQINIEGVLANTYMMSLWSVEFKYSNGISSHMAGNDCTQITPLDIPGQMQITCIVTISDDNLLLEILIKLDPVERRRRGLTKEKIELMESVIGPWTVCDGQDEECKKQMVEPSKIIEEVLDEKDEDGEDKEKSDNEKINIGLVVTVVVMAIIIILVIIYFIRRLRRAKAEGKTAVEKKEEIQTNGITIKMETEQGLKEEGLSNQI